MRKKTFWLIVLSVFLTANPVSGWFWEKKDVQVQAPEVSAVANKMPFFTEKNIAASGKVNSTDFAGKVVLVNFWATWCPPCRKEIPFLISLQDKYKDKGFSVIGISLDDGGSRAVSQFLDKLGVNYPVFIGDAKISRAFGGVMGIPVSFLVDREGNLIKRLDGYISEKVLDRELAQLLE